jgi:outer membrane protein OmpA-like peptidoglycan-associated protein
MIKSTLKKALLIALALIPVTIFAQEQANPSNYWFIGIEGGGTQLFADNQPWKFDQTSWNAGLDLGYVFHNSAYIYANFDVLRFKGKYEKFFEIEECKAMQLNMNVGYDILQLFSLKADRVIGIVPHLGWGLLNHRTTTKYEDGHVVKTGYKDNNPGDGIGGRRNVMQIPMGINFMFNFTKHFRANIDLATNYTSTDWLDGRGGKGSHYDDWWAYANIGLAYKFGGKEILPCPTCPDPSEMTPSCDQCADAIKDAVKDAMKEDRAEQAAAAEAEAAQAAEAEDEAVWEEKDVHVQFKAGKAEVLKTQANEEEAKKVSDDIEAGREVSNIKTVGYASPEGNDEQNQQLSEDRANATAEYIKEKLGDKAEGIEFESEGMGSDWKGFYDALAESNIADKDKIAKKIKNSETPTETLNQLRGQYPELNDILETLRRTQVYVK